MNRDFIESFAAGGDILRRAVQGLSRDDLIARPGPGAWSIQELVVHMADSDEIAIDRMKRILTEDNPPLLYADESAYIARLHTARAVARRCPDTLRSRSPAMEPRAPQLPDEAFSRTGTHNRKGVFTLGEMVVVTPSISNITSSS